MDNNGKPDIVQAMASKSSVLQNQSSPGAISFTEQVVYNLGPNQGLQLKLSDLNGAGKEDILFAKSLSSFIFKNESVAGNLSFAAPVNTAFRSVETGDVDGDHKIDILNITDSIKIYRNLIGDSPAYLCGGGYLSISSNMNGAAYQWQQNTGAGFANIFDGGNFSGTQTANLQVNAIPTSWYGSTLRCLVNGSVNSTETEIKIRNYWTGAVSNSWENPGNWSCGQVPDLYTDVIISAGNAFISSNTTVSSMIITSGATVTVQSGVNFTVLY